MAQQNRNSHNFSPKSSSLRFAFAGIAAASLLTGSLAPVVAAATPAQTPATIDAQALQVAAAKKVNRAGTIALPEGLTPAHDSVFWEDSTACKNFTFKQLGGPYTNESSPVIGCFEGYAAFYNKSSKYYVNLPYDQIDGDYWRLTVAKWDGTKWNTIPVKDDAFYTTYPLLSTWTWPGSPTVEETMDEQLAEMGVNVSDKHKLVGPNSPTWAPQQRVRSWTAVKDSSLGVSGKVPQGWSIASNRFEYKNLFVFDKYGETELSFYFFPNSSGFSGNTADRKCADDGMSYKVEARSKTQLGEKGKRLDIALLTINDGDRTFHRYSLIPADAPKSGKNCMVSGMYAVSKNLVVDANLKNLGEFSSSRDLRKFAHSNAWKNVVRTVQSLSFK